MRQRALPAALLLETSSSQQIKTHHRNPQSIGANLLVVGPLGFNGFSTDDLPALNKPTKRRLAISHS